MKAHIAKTHSCAHAQTFNETGLFRGVSLIVGVETCEVFHCFVAIVRYRVCYVDFLCFLCSVSLVSVTGCYTED